MADGEKLSMSYRLLFFQLLMGLCTGICSSCMHLSGQDLLTFVPDPTWPCGMPEGIPAPEYGVEICTVELRLDHVYDIGETPYGWRTVFVIGGGVVSGPKLSGTVLSGGLDYQLKLSNGIVEIEQVLVLRTGDGKVVYLRNAGVGIDGDDVRVVMDFEAPNEGLYTWLNSGRYVAHRSVDLNAGTMKLIVHDVSDVRATNAVTLMKPDDHPPQPWKPRRPEPSENPGEPIATERVTLGEWMSVGESKRGTRNIILITGGELAGPVHGTVLSAGADFQLQSGTFTLDARYLWQTDGGEVVIVRNAGTLGTLVPVFEARVDGPCSRLNTGTYLSSDPKVGDGFVDLVMYRSRP